MKIVDGVKFSSLNSGIKYKNRDDLMLAVFDDEASVAGVFTKSNIVSSTVTWCRESLKNKGARALIVNAGNANTFTGQAGEEIVVKTAQSVCQNVGCESNEVFISSTGVIGELFDYNLITQKVSQLVENLGDSEKNFVGAAKSIVTTDLVEKISHKEIEIDGEKILIQGFCKGSGMIAPNMATMLSYIFSDVTISSDLLQEIVDELNEKSFNSITVDSDCSTNDSSIVFATNKSQVEIKKNDDSYQKFKDGLFEVMLDLAKQIVKDGEGAKKLIEVNILNARNEDEAKIAGLAVANSPLVKAAIAGLDPNWGRIMMAIGKSQVELNMKKIGLKVGDFVIVENGEISSKYVEKNAHEYMKNNDEIKLFINLGVSDASWTVYGCDLTEEYVKINKDYRT